MLNEYTPDEIDQTISYPDETYDILADPEYIDPEPTQVYPGLTGVDQPGEMTDEIPQVEEPVTDTEQPIEEEPDIVEMPSDIDTDFAIASADTGTADGIIAAISDLSDEEREKLGQKLVTLEDLKAVWDSRFRPMGMAPDGSLDNLFYPGVYLVNPDTTSVPDSKWGVVIVFSPFTEYDRNTTQILVHQTKTYSRARFGNPEKWTAWR